MSGDGDPAANGPRAVAAAPVRLGDLSPRPRVSVVVPNHDYGRYLAEAVSSALEQGYADLEVLVCDDGSTDDSVAIAEELAGRDARVRVLASAENRGQAAAFNRGVAAATGEVICFLDSDDVWLPGKVDRVVRAFGESGAGLVLHPMVVVDDAGRELQRIPSFTSFEQGWIAPRVVRRGGRWRWMPASGVAMRSEVARMVFPMPEEGFRTAADTFALVLAPLLTEVHCVDEILGRYRRHGANAFARSTLEPRRIRRALGVWDATLPAVNGRLGQLDRNGIELRVADNLRYQELQLQVRLLEGAPIRELLGRFRRLMHAYRRDDLYGGMQKLWGPVLYGIAILLPVGSRSAWLSRSLTVSPAKERIRRMLGSRRRG